MPPNPFRADEIEVALAHRYRVDGELRSGGQGAVFRAVRLKRGDGFACNDQVALKLHFDPKQDVRVEREIRAMLQLSHPALSELLEHGFCDIAGTRTRYIAWQFIDGDALDTRLGHGPLNEKGAAAMAAHVCSAIEAIWSRRIVHRDVNPKNIMLKRSGGAVLIDLGGARHLDETSVTAAGSTFGTPGYFSPEQFRAERALTCASDVFSLGIVVQQCLLGTHPTGYDQHRLVSNPPRTKALIPSASDRVAAMVDRMLSLRAAFRPTPNDLRIFFENSGEG